ncbi:MAG: glycoside hydrolase family 3 N-terminal domain-containing protein [Candidatus Wenzhouxiangella sp. M2_3B_020]
MPDRKTVLAAVALLLFVAACSEPDSGPASPADTAAATRPEAEPQSAVSEAWPEIARTTDPETERFVDDVLSRLSLERKIGQIIQAEIQNVTPDEVREYGLGSVLNGGGSFPGQDRRAAVADWTALTTAYHDAGLEAGRGDPAIPLLWGTDAVHGHNNVFGATVFPHNIGLGATRDADLVREIGRATAAQVAATGIDWTFAPTLAVARDPRWGRTYESFSSEPELVARLGRAALLGLQGERGENWLRGDRVLATAKHFVADGGTEGGVDQGDARMSEEELARIHGLPYEAALEAGAQTVMASFSSWNGRKMHGHRYLLTEVLKERMGFDGLVVGDWNGHGQLPECTVSDCVVALEAGIDLFMVPEDWRAFYDNMLEHAREGRLSMERLDDAVRRILRVKKRAGLFDARVDGSDQLPARDEKRELARRAVRQSLVLLKNQGGVLPLDPTSNILVVGHGADDIGKQSGGWTLDWQGVSNANDLFPHGESIHDGIAAHVAAAGGTVRLGESGNEGFQPDAVIAVIGEEPYAEGQGDLESLEFQAGTREAIDLLDRVARFEAPVITVFLSGRPMWVHPELNRSDAFVAAWLPGTEGGGVADVLLASPDGQVHHDFTGQLPFQWPATPTPSDDGQWPALFPLGFGLTYADDGALDRLPEDAMAPLLDDVIPDSGDWTLFDGSAQTPWRLEIRGHNNAADPAVELTDRRIQGDARRITWTEGVPGTVALVARPPVDLGRFLAEDAVVAYDLRVEMPVPESVSARLSCAENCAGESLELGPLLSGLPRDEWRTLRIDLACYTPDGADLSSVDRIELLTTENAARFSIADVRLEIEAAQDADLSCSP